MAPPQIDTHLHIARRKSAMGNGLMGCLKGTASCGGFWHADAYVGAEARKGRVLFWKGSARKWWWEPKTASRKWRAENKQDPEGDLCIFGIFLDAFSEAA